MITLYKACKLIQLEDSEICYLRKKDASRYDCEILTGKDIKNKYDMRDTHVVSIKPRFFEYDYCGMELEIV